MSEEQLSALLAKLKEDAGLQEKLKGAADLDTAVEIAKKAGFDVSKADLITYQVQEVVSDDDLEGVAGGNPLAVGADPGIFPTVYPNLRPECQR
jgi:predicted ribosomally synthesized peptide with nif11-like leader